MGSEAQINTQMGTRVYVGNLPVSIADKEVRLLRCWSLG